MTRCRTVVRTGEGLQHNAMVEGTHTAASPTASPCAGAALRARSAACTTPCSSAQAAQPTFASRTCAIQKIESTCNKHLCKPSALLELHVQVQSCSMHEQGCRVLCRLAACTTPCSSAQDAQSTYASGTCAIHKIRHCNEYIT